MIGTPARQASAAEGHWTFACKSDNDLFRVLAANAGPSHPPARFDSPAAAVAETANGGAILCLADGYPERTTDLDETVLRTAENKGLRVYVEFPSKLPELEIGDPQPVGLRRGVVGSVFFGDALPPGRIVVIHGGQFVSVGQAGLELGSAARLPLVLAKVAGVDDAAFGLANTATEPLLFAHPRRPVLVATTKLSQFVTGRYLPSQAWAAIWKSILEYLQPGASVPALVWTPTVRPSYARDETLPADAERQALRRAASWVSHSGVLRHPNWPEEALRRSDTYNTVRDAPPAGWPRGDGSFGLLEGYSSTIRTDGSQPMRYAVRNDCVLETAMMLAFDATLAHRPDSARIATNLLTYLFTQSGLAGGPRADPNAASFGLLGWALDSPGSYWGDDNARALLGLATASILLGDRRWDEAAARCLIANLRTTGRAGFREACVTEAALAKRGWRSFWDASPVQYSPHFQSWLWACYLRLYEQTRFEPFRERSRAGLRATMNAYPDRWDWVLRSAGIERARLLLPLAWLVRVEDTAEHRGWLRRVADDLIALQASSGAIR